MVHLFLNPQQDDPMAKSFEEEGDLNMPSIKMFYPPGDHIPT